MTVFLGYSQAALDAQMNLREQVPEYGRFFDVWERDSAEVRESLPGVQTNVRYGSGDRQLLDLFLPEGAEGAPLLIFIHGGFWQVLSKDHFSFLAPAFVNARIGFAALGYDLCPDVSLDALVAELREGLDWIAHHAEDYGLSPDRVFVAGHSAGGHLATMLAATDWAARGLPQDLIKGACSVSGLYDLEPVRLSFHNEVLRLTQKAAARLSPVLHPSVCPLILAVGENETDEFLRQQKVYAAAMRRMGVSIREIPMPNFHHFDIVAELGNPRSALHQAILGLMTPSGASAR